jgi:hypothetical protein
MASVTRMIWPPRDSTSFMLLSVFANNASRGRMTTTGTSSVIKAMGPCFSSPAG